MTGPVDFQGTTPSGVPRGVLVGVVAIVLVLALSVAKPWDSQPPPGPTPPPNVALATPSATLPTLAPTAAPSTSPDLADRFTLDPPTPDGVRWTGLRWIPLGTKVPAATLTSVTRWLGGWVALGDGIGRGARRVWASPDGVVWSRIIDGTPTTFWSGTEVLAVAPLGSSVVALSLLPNLVCEASSCPPGSNPFQLTLWSSSDGLRWEPVADVIEPTVGAATDAEFDLVGGPAGLVLAVTPPAANSGPAASSVFVSADGREWQRVASLPDGFSVTSATATDSGTLLAGRLHAGGRTVAAVARSEDLRTWRVQRLPNEPGRPAPQTVWSIRAAPGGLLAVGSANDAAGTELWWQSPDGTAWSPVVDYAPLGATDCGAIRSPCGPTANGVVAGDEQRLLALQLGKDRRAWTSSGDGQWYLIGNGDPGPASAPLRVLLLPGGVIVSTSDRLWYGQATVDDSGG